MKYRKKPVIIDAMLWHGRNKREKEWPIWFVIAVDAGIIYCDSKTESLFIKTSEGIMEGKIGDYIIKGIKDELYPCKPDIFELTYEPLRNQDETM